MLGEPITASERRHVFDYSRGLGVDPPVSVEHVSDWNQARDVIQNPAWDQRFWDAERLETRRLYGTAREARGAPELLELLSRTLESGESVYGAAAVAAARRGCSDVGLIGAAAGAASEALHLAQLATLAGEPAVHPFFVKQALFAAGHWPLGAISGRFYVF
jgi:hypothetical protein